MEGLAALEVPGHAEPILAVAPGLADLDPADEAIAVGSDRLALIEDVADREGEGEPLAETLLDAGLQHVVGHHPDIAQVDAALVEVRAVDVELGRQREGVRDVDECPVEVLLGAV